MDRQITHVVIKNDDIKQYLTPAEQNTLIALQKKITDGRMNDGKVAINEYYIVNKDEPYAEFVKQLILDGEHVKNNFGF